MCPATDDNAAQGDLDQPECSDYLLTVPNVGGSEKMFIIAAEGGEYQRKMITVYN